MSEFVDLTDEDEVESVSSFNEWCFSPTEVSDETDVTTLPLNLGKIYFHTIKYSGDCVYLWCGDGNTRLDNVVCSMKTPYKQEPLTTSLMSNCQEGQDMAAMATSDLACKLSKRLKKQVFVSLNVAFGLLGDSCLQANFMKLIELALFKEIKLNPQKF